jgi:hypothetical protein
MKTLSKLNLAVVLALASLSPLRAADPAPAKPAEPVKTATPASADAAPAKAEKGFISLFDGKSLAGWVVTGCKAEVEDGKLVIVDGNGFIRSEKIYGDFILEVDWKNRKPEKYDSGIFIRADLPRKNNNWPDRYQLNLLQGAEGNLIPHKTAKSAGLAKAGEWNRFKVTCVGPNVELEINGKPAWKIDDLKAAQGYIGIQVEVPGGGQFEFKNIRIKPLTPPVDPPARPAK